MVITQVFLSSAEHKEDILKNVGKQTVDSSHSKVFFSPILWKSMANVSKWWQYFHFGWTIALI